jgi:hypothetical protein
MIFTKTKIIIVIMTLFTLSGLNHKNKIIINDSCDYLEINHVYKIDDDTGNTKLRLVQYVWWEWRDSILIPALDPQTKQKTGLIKKGSGFVVREYVVVENNYIKPKRIVHAHLSKAKKGWICIYYDSSSKLIRQISFKWIVTTHTLYDSELDNRDIIALKDRNSFVKR